MKCIKHDGPNGLSVRMAALIGLSAAALAARPASATPYPDGFEALTGGTQVAAVRVDSRGDLDSFEKVREGHLAVWRAAVEIAAATGRPAPPEPVFRPGYNRPVQSHTARFIRLDRTADVRLTTLKAYSCKGSMTIAEPLICGPTVQRSILLYKLIDGRRHIWKANLDDGKGTHQIDPRSSQTRLSRLNEEDAVRLGIGTQMELETHQGYPCRVRLIGEHRVCYYTEQADTPAALHSVVAWNYHVSDPKRYTRLEHVNGADTISAIYFEPPENVRFVVFGTGSPLSGGTGGRQ